MNRISTTILLVLVLIVGAVSIYQYMCIQEFKRDVAAFSENVQQFSQDVEDLSEDIQQLNGDMQDVRFQMRGIDTAVTLILKELWLVRPQVPDPRPWQARE